MSKTFLNWIYSEHSINIMIFLYGNMTWMFLLDNNIEDGSQQQWMNCDCYQACLIKSFIFVSFIILFC